MDALESQPDSTMTGQPEEHYSRCMGVIDVLDDGEEVLCGIQIPFNEQLCSMCR